MFGGQTKYLPARQGEARVTLADISYTTEKTGWIPNHDLETYVADFLEGK